MIIYIYVIWCNIYYICIYIYILHITNNTVCIDLKWNDTYCWAVAIRCQMCSHAQWPTLDLRFFLLALHILTHPAVSHWICGFTCLFCELPISISHWIGLRKFTGKPFKKIYRKTLYLMVKTIVSCRFSLKPIQWISLQWLVWLVTSIGTTNFTRNG